MSVTNSGRIAINGLISWDILRPSDASQALQLDRVEVSNGSAGTMEIGWGEELPFKMGKIVSSIFSEITLPYTFASGELLAIVAPKKFDALYIAVGTVADGATTFGVYNGTNFTTAGVTAHLGAINVAVNDANAILDPVNAWVAGGIAAYPGQYALVSSNAVGLEIDSIRIGKVLDFVTTVAAGNHAVRTYDRIPIKIYKNKGVFAYTSDAAQTTSIGIVDYQAV